MNWKHASVNYRANKKLLPIAGVPIVYSQMMQWLCCKNMDTALVGSSKDGRIGKL
jgi:hypothetical protein